MARATTILIAAIAGFAFAVSTPALALNPQPLPPGLHRSGAAVPALRHASRAHVARAANERYHRSPALPYSPQWGGFYR